MSQPKYDRRLADYAMVFELLGSLPEVTAEVKVIERIFELFTMFFAPNHLIYLSFVEGKEAEVFPSTVTSEEIEALKNCMSHLKDKYRWTESSCGFILPLHYNEEKLGIIKVDGIAFPQYKEHYLNLALTIIRVCALAISNARAFERVKQSEISLKNAYDALKRSQAQLVQAEKISALGTMVAGVAHELNNPLMIILNFIQYSLRKTSKEDKRFHVLSDAEEQTKRCIEVVNSLLAFSHMDQEIKGEFKKCNFTTVLKQVINLLAYQISKEDALVTTSYAPDVPEIWIDINSIQQVFINIIVNSLDALRYSDKKEIHIELSVKNKFVSIIISDSGQGIDEENIQKIFDPFFTTKPTGQGTGLGLSICRTILDMHNGEITCTSIPGQGTVFEILLPLVKKSKEIR